MTFSIKDSNFTSICYMNFVIAKYQAMH